jgi:hypothetical protein
LGGVVYAANSSVQRECGINDDAQAMYRYQMILNQYRLTPSVNRIICERRHRERREGQRLPLQSGANRSGK